MVDLKEFSMKKLWICLFVLVGCEAKQDTTSVVEQKKYKVVSSFNEICLETDDEAHAYKTALYLGQMGRVFASKPDYFVIERKNEANR
jgi:hypothetical protein